MKAFNLSYKPYGDSAILIEWPQKISKNILYDTLQFKQKIEKRKIKAILDINTIYNSMLIIYERLEFSYETSIKTLKIIYNQEYTKLQGLTVDRWFIPVCYHLNYGLDLAYLAQLKDASVKEIIRLHKRPIYTIFGIGFLPGFLYLGGLEKELYTPRKKTPRRTVPEGAVAIGGNQTGIYPQPSPGGWHIIGKTPVELFDKTKNKPCLFKPGDEIKFQEISLHKFIEFETEINLGNFKLKKISVDAEGY